MASLGPKITKILTNLISTGAWYYMISGSLWVEFLLNKKLCSGFKNAKKTFLAVTRGRTWSTKEQGSTFGKLYHCTSSSVDIFFTIKIVTTNGCNASRIHHQSAFS